MPISKCMGPMQDGEVRKYTLTGNWDPIIIGLISLISCGIPCFGCWLWDRVEMTFEPEELFVERTNMCCTNRKRLPYGELGGVDKNENCCGCVGIGGEGSPVGSISPGWGQQYALVEEVIALLKERQRARGDTGQIKRAEENQAKLAVLEAKLDAIMAHLQIQPPPSVEMSKEVANPAFER